MVALFLMLGCKAQIPAGSPRTGNPQFDAEIARLLKFSVPLISVEKFKEKTDSYTIIDTREPKEFAVSHIKNAINIPYSSFDEDKVARLPKETPIVVYCSVGYRSEKTGNKLQKMGFTQVYNLYGSIFEWANRAYPLVNREGQSTRLLHTYNEKWSQWVTNPIVEKTW